MKHVCIKNTQGRWFVSRLDGFGNVQSWCDDTIDAMEFTPRTALELAFRYNRSHIGPRATIERVKRKRAPDFQDAFRKELGL